MDYSPPSSLTDTEQKGEVVTVTDGNSALEYERFLHLDNVFNGPAKKRLIRKCKTC